MKHTAWFLLVACVTACGRVAGRDPADAALDAAPDDLPCEVRAVPCGEEWAGTGADGDLRATASLDLIVAGFTKPLTVTTVNGAEIGVSARDSHLARGDEVLLLYLRGLAGDIDHLGDHETAFVESVSDTKVVLRAPVQHSFPSNTGAVPGSTVVLVRIPHFKNLVVGAQGALLASAFDGTVGGVLYLRAQQLDVQKDGLIAMTASGYRGRGPASNGLSGDSGETYVTGSAHGGPPFHGAGGGGRSECDAADCTRQALGAGGGGSSFGTMGAPGASNGSLQTGGLPGGVYGDAPLSRLFLGSGGGGGAGGVQGPGSGTAGGNGGGIIVIRAGAVHVAGRIESNGQSGSVNDNCTIGNGSGSGGGGAGGTIWLSAHTLQVEGTIRATGGGISCHGGGAGGDGRIRLDFGTINGAAVGSTEATAAVNAISMPQPGFVGPLP